MDDLSGQWAHCLPNKNKRRENKNSAGNRTPLTMIHFQGFVQIWFTCFSSMSAV